MQSIKKYFVVSLGCLKYARRRVLQSSLPVTVIFLGPREMGNTGWKTRAFFPHLKVTQGYPEPGYNISNGNTTCVLCRAMHATSP